MARAVQLTRDMSASKTAEILCPFNLLMGRRVAVGTASDSVHEVEIVKADEGAAGRIAARVAARYDANCRPTVAQIAEAAARA